MRAILILTASVALAAADETPDAGKKTAAALQGDWQIESAESLKKESKEYKDRKVTIKDDTLTIHLEKPVVWTFKLDPSKLPNRIDFYDGKDLVARSIFEQNGETLKFCLGLAQYQEKDGIKQLIKAGDRPEIFDSSRGDLLTLKRSK